MNDYQYVELMQSKTCQFEQINRKQLGTMAYH